MLRSIGSFLALALLISPVLAEPLAPPQPAPAPAPPQLAQPAPAPQAAPPATSPAADKLTQVQAADLLSELLTYYGDLSIARADAMKTYIDQIGKVSDFRMRSPTPPKPARMTFQDIYKTAILFTQQGGRQYADPCLAKMSPTELQTELDALQYFNLQQFLFFNEQRDQIARMRAYLEMIGHFDKYLAWSQDRLADPVLSTTGPTTRTIEAGAAWLTEQLQNAKSKAWERAKAEGMSEEAFNEKWKDRVGELRESAEGRISAVKKLGTFFRPSSTFVPSLTTQPSASNAAGGKPLPPAPISPMPAVGIIRPGAAAGAVGTPLTANDPRWQANYYGPNNPYNNFGDEFTDVMKPSGGGGSYARYDKRVNTDYDLRVKGELDRRVNVSSDRRLNIHTDPRVNF